MTPNQPLTFETISATATIILGERLGRFLKAGMVVGLYGELGSGKTTLIKGFARGLGVKETVKSPSFVIITEYQGRIPVYHIDLYRIRSPKEFIEIGLDSYLGADGVCLVEWAERAEELLPEKSIRVHLSVIPGGRKIEIHGLDPGLVQELKQTG
ncbi:MAG: tRNA (adenosine(37)-N6)-threonylcarbamoyltransferase complex ATPase subunit type 1 TsaE [bacterium]